MALGFFGGSKPMLDRSRNSLSSVRFVLAVYIFSLCMSFLPDQIFALGNQSIVFIGDSHGVVAARSIIHNHTGDADIDISVASGEVKGEWQGSNGHIWFDALNERSLGGGGKDGFAAIEEAASKIQGATAIVIELGTFGDDSSTPFRTQLNQAVRRIRELNSEIQIHWVNVGAKGNSSAEGNAAKQSAWSVVNRAIDEIGGISVVNWYGRVFPGDIEKKYAIDSTLDDTNSYLKADGVNLKPSGAVALASLAVTTVNRGVSNTPVQPGGSETTITDFEAVYGGLVWVPGQDTCIGTRQPTNTSSAASPTEKLSNFTSQYGQSAFNIGKQYGIPYEAILAQAILESGYGESKLTKEANNFFGIKAGPNWDGEVYTARTREVDGSGNDYYVNADFRAYPNAEEGFRGYAEFIINGTHYQDALGYPNDPIEYIKHLVDRDEEGEKAYATDPRYVEILSDIIANITSYIADNNLFPPSSEVVPDRAPPAGGGTGAQFTSADRCGAVDVTDVVFDTSRSDTFDLGSKLDSADAVVLHWTGGNYAEGREVDQFINAIKSNDSCPGGCSVQLFIDKTGKVWQLSPSLDSLTYHACGVNKHSIGIEIEGGGENDLVSNAEQTKSVIGTVVKLVKQFPSIDYTKQDPRNAEGILGHFEIPPHYPGCSGKSDPGPSYLESVRNAVRAAISSGSADRIGACPEGVSQTAPYQEYCETLKQIISQNQSQFDSLKSQKLNSGGLIDPSETVPVGNTSIIRSAKADYDAMVSAAATSSPSIILEPVSAYRSFEDQALQRIKFCTDSQRIVTYDRIFLEGAPTSCSTAVALPGNSKHNTGTAVDFGINGITDDPGFANTPAYQWLSSNASRFGFKTIEGEPWHWER